MKNRSVDIETLPSGAWLTIKDVAAYCGKHPMTIRRWSESKMLPPLRKVGPNTVVFFAGELREALARLAA